MPVLVTTAERPLARRIVTRLIAEGGEVRAYSDSDVSSLRAAGAIVARGAPDDEGRLEAALTDVHTVVYLGAGLISADPEDVEGRWGAALVSAARNAGVSRIIALSVPGVASDGDRLRRAKHATEHALAGVDLPTVVLRCGLVDTPAVRDALLTAGIGKDGLAATITPVRPDDLVELVAAFDDARSRARTGHLVATANGPVRTTVAAYLDEVVGPIASRRGRLLVSSESARTLIDALNGPWWDDEPHLVDGWEFAGLKPAAPSRRDQDS